MNLYLFKPFTLFICLLCTGCSAHTRPMSTATNNTVIIDHLASQRKRITVAIDAGHGGKDSGAKAISGDVTEKELTLVCALHVQRILEKSGLHTLMIRADDTTMPVHTRAQFANANKASLYVSLHFNSAPSESAHGIEIFRYDGDDEDKRLIASQNLAESVLTQVLMTTKAKSRGVKKGNYAVIRETDMPAILVEGGFLTNKQDVQKLKNPSYLERLSIGVAHGVVEYLKNKKKLHQES